MSPEQPERRPWKHVLALALWLSLAPPIGLWKLWQDNTLSSTAKWRILIYLCVLPFLAYLAFQLFMVNHAFMRLDA